MKHVDRIDGLEWTSHLLALAGPAALLARRRTRFTCGFLSVSAGVSKGKMEISGVESRCGAVV
jgi:hypothetical protein